MRPARVTHGRISKCRLLAFGKNLPFKTSWLQSTDNQRIVIEKAFAVGAQIDHTVATF
jgi:hypothetical protein